jgi:SAM-dependent methyltransferase
VSWTLAREPAYVRLRFREIQALTISGAIDFADQNPSAEVLGNDLSPTQPAWVPPNLNFIVDDIEDEWGYENDKFDFVHARYRAGAIKDWPRLIEQAFRNTKPGGWLEFQEWDFRYYCADGSVSRDSGIWSFHNHVCNRLEAAGFDASPGARLEKWFHDVGFVNVQAYCLPIPLGTWAKDKKLVS